MKHSMKLPANRHYRVLFEVGSLSGLSDRELLARFVNREGDAAELAFTSLVERHARMIMRICRAILSTTSSTETYISSLSALASSVIWLLQCKITSAV